MNTVFGAASLSNTPLTTESSALVRWMCMVSVLLGAIVLRVGFLTADPPPYHPYGTAWGDEGFWTWPAAIRAVQGRGSQTDDPWARLAPLYVGVQERVLATFGVSLPTIRATSVVAGVVVTLLVMVVVTRAVGIEAGLVAGIGYATLFPALIFERLATPEALANLFAASTLVTLAAGQSYYAAAAALAIAAALCKVSALPFLGMAGAVFVLDLRSKKLAGDRPPPLALTVVLVVLLALPAIFLFHNLPASYRQTTGIAVGIQRAFLNAFSAATTRWYYWSGAVWVIGAAIHLAVPTVPSLPRQDRLSRLCALWIVSWFAIVPWMDAKGGRLYLLSVPLVIVGSLGWSRLIDKRADLPWAGRSVTGRLRAEAAVAWLVLLAAVFLSEEVGLRAAFGFPVLLLVSITARCLFSGRIATAIRAAQRTSRRRLWAILAAGVFANQLPLYLAWVQERAYVMANAIDAVEKRFPSHGDVCGQAAPILLLGKPSMGDAIVPVFRSEDCRTEGQLADYVLLPARASCQEFAHDWLEQNRSRIARESAVARVTLPECDYALVPLLVGAGQQTDGPWMATRG